MATKDKKCRTNWYRIEIYILSISLVVSIVYQGYQTQAMRDQLAVDMRKERLEAAYEAPYDEVIAEAFLTLIPQDPAYESHIDSEHENISEKMKARSRGKRPGFEVFTERLFAAASTHRWEEVNSLGGANKLDTQDYRENTYGSDMAGFGPYYPSTGRSRGEIAHVNEGVMVFKREGMFFIYYKLGHWNGTSYEPEGPSFMIDRLAIRVLKPRDLIRYWSEIESDKTSPERLLVIFERLGVLVTAFRWGWEWPTKDGDPAAPHKIHPIVTTKGVSDRAFAIADEINFRIYNRSKYENDRIVPVLPRSNAPIQSSAHSCPCCQQTR